MMSKIDVNGPKAIPLYQWLRTNSSLKGGNIPWNFAKFLLNANGEIVKYYLPAVNPVDIVPDIVTLINQPAAEEEELEVMRAENIDQFE